MILAAILLPLLAAFWVSALRTEHPQALAMWAVLSGLPAAVLALTDGYQTLELPALLFSTKLGLTPVTEVFLLLSALLWIISGVYAASSLNPGPKKTRYFLFHFLSMAGNIGLILALDLATFYTFFALMTLTAYALVIHQEREEDWRAGTIYIVMTLVGEVLLLAGLFLAVSVTGSMALESLSEAALDPERGQAFMICVWLGFGIKAGALPVHFWLPLAHSSAPAPGSAVLSGSMIKAGLLGWLTLFPIGSQGFVGWGQFLIVLGFAASFLGVVLGFLQTDPKANLAYSSVSQMGLMTCLVGMVLMTPGIVAEAQVAILVFAFVHALAKGTLFLGAGLSYDAGRARHGDKILLVGLGIAALSIAGLPLTGGGMAKKLMKATSEALPSVWADAIPWLLALGSVGTSMLLGRFLWLVWQKMRTSRNGKAPSYFMWGAWMAGLVLVLSGSNLAAGNLGSMGASGLTGKMLLEGLGPIALGLLGLRLCQGGDTLVARFPIPPGDIVVLARPLVWAFGFLRKPARFWLTFSSWLLASPKIERRTSALHKVEMLMEEWSIAGTVFVFLLLAFVLFQRAGLS